MRDIDIYSSDILLDQKSYKIYEKVLLYDILHKTLAGGKTLRIRFDSIHHNFGRIKLIHIILCLSKKIDFL